MARCIKLKPGWQRRAIGQRCCIGQGVPGANIGKRVGKHHVTELLVFGYGNIYKCLCHHGNISERINSQPFFNFVRNDQEPVTGNKTFWRDKAGITLNINKFYK